VRDDGAGFDTAARSEGFGLIGMRERVALAGGSLEVTSQPGEGATITARLPVRRRPPAHPASADALAAEDRPSAAAGGR
jgi:signal transduction histidine kinase